MKKQIKLYSKLVFDEERKVDTDVEKTIMELEKLQVEE